LRRPAFVGLQCRLVPFLAGDSVVDCRRVHCRLKSLPKTGPLFTFDPQKEYGYV